MLSLLSSLYWSHCNKDERLESLRTSAFVLRDMLQEERAARLRLLQHLGLEEVPGPIIRPVS